MRKRRAVAGRPAGLSALIPEPEFGTEYVPRHFDGVQDLAILQYARQYRENTLISGPTGPGKTSVVLAFCAIKKIPMVTVACNGAIDPSTLFGQRSIATDGSVVYRESSVLQVMREGGVLYLDEVNFAPPRIMSVLHGALDKRRVVVVPELENEQIKLHPDCQIIATYNPGYEGTKPLNKAFLNRFPMKLTFDYDRKIEEQLVVTVPALLDVADRLRAAAESGDLETPVPTNLLREFEDHAFDMGVAFAVTIFLNAFQPHERSAVSDAMLHFRAEIEKQVKAAQDGDAEFNKESN